MGFAYAPMQWQNVAQFTEHLHNHDPSVAPWARGVVVHHTYRPLPSQWHGLKSIAGLKEYYLAKEWDAGPHLFICTGATNPADDGIFQLTPLNMRGIHATYANSAYWGIEVVGDYDGMPWSNATASMVYGTIRALFGWRGLSFDTTITMHLNRTGKTETYTLPAVIGHREVPYTVKSCPGKMIDMNVVRSQLKTV